DAVAAYRLTEMAANINGLCYVRTHRPDVPLIYPQDATFKLGGCGKLAEGNSVTIVGSGYMTTLALAAVRELEKAGIKCNLFDACTRPVDAEPMLSAARKANGVSLTGEGDVAGGFNAGLAEAAARAGGVKVVAMACPGIPKSGKDGDIALTSLGLG